MNWLDIGIIIVCLILIIISIKRGFMSSVLSNFNLSTNAFISFFLCKPIKILINHFGGGEAIRAAYYEKLVASNACFETNLIGLAESELPTFVSSTLENSSLTGVSKFMFRRYANTSTLYSTLQESGLETRTLGNIVSESLSKFFITVISFVVALILVFIVLKVIEKLVEKLRKIGAIRVVDGLLGAVYGAFRCLILFTVLCVIIKLMSPLSFMKSVTDYISSSMFGKVIYDQINTFIDRYLNFQQIIQSVFPT